MTIRWVSTDTNPIISTTCNLIVVNIIIQAEATEGVTCTSDRANTTGRTIQITLRTVETVVTVEGTTHQEEEAITAHITIRVTTKLMEMVDKDTNSSTTAEAASHHTEAMT